MKNLSKKQMKLQKYSMYNRNSKHVINQKLIKNAELNNLTVSELQYMSNDRWKLLIF